MECISIAMPVITASFEKRISISHLSDDPDNHIKFSKWLVNESIGLIDGKHDLAYPDQNIRVVFTIVTSWVSMERIK